MSDPVGTPTLGKIETTTLRDLSTELRGRGRRLLENGRGLYLAGLGVVETARREGTAADQQAQTRAGDAYETLVARGTSLDAEGAERAAEVRDAVRARTRRAAERVDGAVVRPARRLVNRVAGPSREEVEALSASVAQLTAKVDALVERLAGAPVVVDTRAAAPQDSADRA
jgi:hypothetical protein